MKFRTKFYAYVGDGSTYSLNPLANEEVRISIALDSENKINSTLDAIDSLPIVGAASAYNFRISVEIGNVLLIDWDTPLNETHIVSISARYVDNVGALGLEFSQDFKTFGYDIGFNTSAGISYNSTNADIVLYKLDVDGFGNKYYLLAHGVFNKVLSYRQPFTDIIHFYYMAAQYHCEQVVGTLIPPHISKINWTNTFSVGISTKEKFGLIVSNGTDGYISSSVEVTNTFTNATIIPYQPGNSLLILKAKWLPAITTTVLKNFISNTITIVPLVSYTGTTKVYVNDAHKYVFLNLRFVFTLTDETNTLYNTWNTAVIMPNIDTFVYDSSLYTYLRVLTRYNKFKASFKVSSYEYPTVSIYEENYEIIPEAFQYITKIGSGVYRIFNPYTTKDIQYKVQTLKDDITFVDITEYVTIPKNTHVEVMFEDGVYNVQIDGANGVLIVDSAVQNGILQLLKQQFESCECHQDGCADTELFVAITMNYMAYLNIVNDLVGCNFLFHQLDLDKLKRITQISVLQKRLATFVNRIKIV